MSIEKSLFSVIVTPVVVGDVSLKEWPSSSTAALISPLSVALPGTCHFCLPLSLRARSSFPFQRQFSPRWSCLTEGTTPAALRSLSGRCDVTDSALQLCHIYPQQIDHICRGAVLKENVWNDGKTTFSNCSPTIFATKSALFEISHRSVLWVLSVSRTEAIR